MNIVKQRERASKRALIWEPQCLSECYIKFDSVLHLGLSLLEYPLIIAPQWSDTLARALCAVHRRAECECDCVRETVVEDSTKREWKWSMSGRAFACVIRRNSSNLWNHLWLSHSNTRTWIAYVARIHKIGHAYRRHIAVAQTNCHLWCSAIFLPSPNRNVKFLHKNINFLCYYLYRKLDARSTATVTLRNEWKKMSTATRGNQRT